MSGLQHPAGGLTVTCPCCSWSGPWNLPFCPNCKVCPIPENQPFPDPAVASTNAFAYVLPVQTIDEVNRRGEP